MRFTMFVHANRLRGDREAVLQRIAGAAARDARTVDACRRLLLPVLRADDERGSALGATLRAYYAHGCNVTATAEALFLHRNSVRYRLDRVRVLVRADIDHAHVSAAFLLAFAVLEAAGDKGEANASVSS